MTQHAFQNIPGIPSGSTKDHTSYIDLITQASNLNLKHKGATKKIDEPFADQIIYLSFLILDGDVWKAKFIRSMAMAHCLYRDAPTYWRSIALALMTPEVEKATLQLLPNLDQEKYFPHPIITPAVQRIAPQPLPKVEPSKVRAREETIVQFITKHAPSINYLQVFILMSRHTGNRFSSRGRKVYPYGQEYVARKLDVSLRTVERIFSWLQRKGIILKRSNENPEHHKSATWFLCSSWKQSIYFRDPEGRRLKKGSSGSRRKRLLHLVHT